MPKIICKNLTYWLFIFGSARLSSKNLYEGKGLSSRHKSKYTKGIV